MNCSDSCWFACFCKRVGIGKENFDILILPFFLIWNFFPLNFSRSLSYLWRWNGFCSEVEKKALSYRPIFLGIVFEHGYEKKHHNNKINLSFIAFHMNNFCFWSSKAYKFFTWLDSKHKFLALQLFSESFSKKLDRHLFLTIKSASFLCS